MDSPVPYFPGKEGQEQIDALVSRMLDPDELDMRYCLLCNELNKPGLVGLAEYSGEQAKLMGAREGKHRAAIYYVCIDCASKFETPELMSAACDAELLRQVTAMNNETRH